MSKRNRQGYAKAKGRGNGRYVGLPLHWLDHDNYIGLSNSAKALLIDLLYQYKGHNNGDLCTALGIMVKRGWKSEATLVKARYELESKGWIVITKQGGNNKPNLYAVTMHPIDDCKGKLDRACTKDPLNYWRTGSNPEISSAAARWLARQDEKQAA